MAVGGAAVPAAWLLGRHRRSALASFHNNNNYDCLRRSRQHQLLHSFGGAAAGGAQVLQPGLAHARRSCFYLGARQPRHLRGC